MSDSTAEMSDKQIVDQTELMRLYRCEARLAAMSLWLEEVHPEVFREGLWDAIARATGGES